MLCGLVRGKPALQQAQGLARQWGSYLVAQGGPKPGVRLPARRNLAILQEAMARAGFDPRFRREAGNSSVEVTLRDCPFRDLADDQRVITDDDLLRETDIGLRCAGLLVRKGEAHQKAVELALSG